MMRLVDRDFIEESNLQRQIMFDERDLAEKLPKAIAAAAHVSRINSESQVEGLVKDVNYANIIELINDVDLILDGTDNFETRYLINDAAVKLKKPWVYGAAVGSYGVQMTIQPYDTPCLRCVFPEPPAPGTSPTCDTAGVILPVVATVASYQVSEALKILTGNNELLHGSLLQFDLWENKFKSIKLDGLRGHGHCRPCEQTKFDYLAARAGQLVIALCGRSAMQVTPASNRQIDLARLAEQLREAGEVSYNRFLLKFKAGSHELTVFPDARTIIKGTDDPNVARSLYARYIGA
jgi:molybdopterin-synthase adenylyltransferase